MERTDYLHVFLPAEKPDAPQTWNTSLEGVLQRVNMAAAAAVKALENPGDQAELEVHFLQQGECATLHATLRRNGIRNVCRALERTLATEPEDQHNFILENYNYALVHEKEPHGANDKITKISLPIVNTPSPFGIPRHYHWISRPPQNRNG